jgi:hypothetical protein
MTRALLAIVLVLAACAAPQERACSAVQTQADVGLVVAAGSGIILTGVAVDPTQVRDSREKRYGRSALELGLMVTTIGGAVAAQMAAGDAQQCIESSETNDAH